MHKNKKVIIITSILLLITLVVGITYAAFNYDFIGGRNVIETGEVSIEFLESNDVISIENAFPISDTKGKQQTDTFDFQVKTNANGNISLKYVLGIEKLEVSTGYTSLNDDEVKVYLTDYNDNALVSPKLISVLGGKLYSKINTHSTEKTEIIDKYKIRVWVDNKVDSSSWDENTKLEYKFKINVNSKQEEAVTVLYNDGTLIINEKLSDRANNIAKHGEVTKEYEAMSEDNPYVFNGVGNVLWFKERTSIKQVEIGSKISPTSTAYWFNQLSNMTTGDFTKLDTSKVTDMNRMFYLTGSNATTFDIDLSGWNTSSVTDMNRMFSGTGRNATTFDIGNLSEWDTSNVTDMEAMFSGTGRNATTFDIGNLSGWNTSKVTNMRNMFWYAGYKATTFNIGDLSGWDTSQVTSMTSMFNGAGYNATWSLDCSKWNINKVTSHKDFNSGVESKVTPPVWVN